MSISSHEDVYHIHKYLSEIDSILKHFLNELQYLELMVGTYE